MTHPIDSLKRPIVALAPMDGVTDMAFRQVVRRLNPEVLLYSEFTNVNGIVHSDFVKSRLDFEPRELPYIVQLFGRDPDTFALIAKQIEDMGITAIDINFGCPSKRIVKNGTGAALLKEPDLALRIVEATAKATKLPVTVKTRLGWADAEGLIPFAKQLQDAGCQLLTLHGRTAKMAYRGVADWGPIYRAKDALSIPVVGNGDLKSPEQALAQLGNLDGYMIGRASMGNPWVFWPQAAREAVSLKDKVEVMIEHFNLLRRTQSEHKALVEFRKHLGGYINGFRDAKTARKELMASETETEFKNKALELAAG
ncbi:MAG: tRNA-dihydrouridine synthase [bacterium]|nr:tRNA-dihydrouridine synthase [bacterium]